MTLRIVDLADFRDEDRRARAAFVAELGAGLSELGFVSVKGANLPPDAIESTYAAMRDFFALPLAEKEGCVVRASNGNRGYVAFGKEHAKNRAVGDLKEFFHVGREIVSLGEAGKNAFPERLPAFREATTRLYDALDAVAQDLLVALAEGLGEPARTIADMATGGNSILRLIHYPRLEDLYVPGAVRAAEHEDINLITLLPESTTSGLEILTREGKWLEVATPKGHLVVDSGDMLARITGGLVPSTTHRVVNPKRPEDDVPRYSMPFFAHPRPEVSLGLLPFAKRDPRAIPASDITADAFLRERLAAIGLER